MAVLAARELVGRTLQHRFGESPTASRVFSVTMDGPSTVAEVAQFVGIFHLAPHPEYGFLRMVDANLTESDRHYATITFSYEVIEQEDLDPNPLARPDVWSFATSGAEVPALYYYEGSGNNDIQPLVNSANEFIPGLTTLVGEVRATISWNRPTFPLSLASAVTGAINDANYLGGETHTWQCQGVSSQQEVEIVNDVEIRYWSGTTELVYRQQGWNLFVPDVGYTYKSGSQRKRSYVLNEDGDKVDSPMPVPLTDTGDIEEDPTVDVRRLERRVFPEVDFNSFFGTPPF